MSANDPSPVATPLDAPELLTLAHQCCARSREIILRYYDSGVQVDWKADASPVTIADKRAEEEMRSWLRDRDTGFGFVGEEYGREAGSNGITWVMDPIDGTKAFIRGVPLFGTILAAFQGGQAVVGMIDLPALDRRLWAVRGGGAWVDGKQVRVSGVSALSQGHLLTGTVNTFDQVGLGDSFTRLRSACGLHRGWGDCFGYFQVACGKADAMVDPVVSIWDVAPMELLFSEAGGRFTDLHGSLGMMALAEDHSRPLKADDCTAVASNGLLHAEILSYFAK